MLIQYEEEWPQYDMEVLESTPSRMLEWDKMRMRVWDSLDYWVIFSSCPRCGTEKYHGYPCPICPQIRRIEINQPIPYQPEPKKVSKPKPIKKDKQEITHKYTRKTVPDQIVVEQPPNGYVYLMKSGNGYHKIGISKNVGQRLDGLKRQFPISIEVIHHIKSKDYRLLERQLHNKFADKRIEYEWFKLSATDIDWFCSLKDFDLDGDL